MAPRRLALVTGGHRRLGGHIAVALAQAGWDVAIHGRHDAAAEPWLGAALAASGAAWHGFVADFLDPQAVLELVPAVAAQFGRAPDLLVNGASLFGQDRLADTDHTALMDHYAVNTAAPVLLSRAFALAAAEAGAGNDCSIVNILDQRLAQPHGDQLAYTLAKMALAGFTRIAARELAPALRVNAVAPGLTLATGDYDAPLMARLAGMMPLERLPQPSDIAAAVLYLASAPCVTGMTIAVDGGAHMESYRRDFMHL